MTDRPISSNQCLDQRLRHKIGGFLLEPDTRDGGDTLAVALCSYFERHIARPADDTESENGWSQWAEDKTNAALDALTRSLAGDSSAPETTDHTYEEVRQLSDDDIIRKALDSKERLTREIGNRYDAACVKLRNFGPHLSESDRIQIGRSQGELAVLAKDGHSYKVRRIAGQALDVITLLQKKMISSRQELPYPASGHGCTGCNSTPCICPQIVSSAEETPERCRCGRRDQPGMIHRTDGPCTVKASGTCGKPVVYTSATLNCWRPEGHSGPCDGIPI